MRRERGTGTINSHGYINVRVKGSRNKKLMHRLIWEQHNGPIPDGMDIHHIDGNGLNNDISNLMLVEHHLHKKLHAGYQLINDVWWKPCRDCGVLKLITEFYMHGNIAVSRCIPCYNKHAKEVRERKSPVKEESIDEIINRLSKNPRSKWQLIDDEWYKSCGKCGELKHVKTEFHKKKNSIESYCIECNSEYMKQYAEANKQKLKEYNKMYRTKIASS